MRNDLIWNWKVMPEENFEKSKPKFFIDCVCMCFNSFSTWSFPFCQMGFWKGNSLIFGELFVNTMALGFSASAIRCFLLLAQISGYSLCCLHISFVSSFSVDLHLVYPMFANSCVVLHLFYMFLGLHWVKALSLFVPHQGNLPWYVKPNTKFTLYFSNYFHLSLLVTD